MTHDEIRAAIAADPALQALVPDTQAIAAALSAGRTRYAETNIGVGTIIEVLGLSVANPVLDAIYASLAIVVQDALHAHVADNIELTVPALTTFLSFPGVIDITPTSARPRITITYPA